MKLTFIKQKDLSNHYDISSVSLNVEADSLPEILQEFKYFLLACGFTVDGDLEIVSEETKNE